MKRVLILACVAVWFNAGSAAQVADQPLVLDVWPGKAVGDHGQIGPERVRAPAEAPTKDAKWITNVTRPTISVFHPDAANRAGVAILICPGGGYWNLAWDKEGEEVAAWLNTLGITGVVLKYRVPRRPGEPEPQPAPGRCSMRSGRSAWCEAGRKSGASTRIGSESWGSRPEDIWQ